MRMPGELDQRLKWLAEQIGGNYSDAVRKVLREGTRDVRPPVRIDERIVAATDKEWNAWRAAAAELGIPLDKLIRDTMNRVTQQVFKTA